MSEAQAKQLAAQELLDRRQARAHMLPFVRYTFGEKFAPGRHHKLLCSALERFEAMVRAKQSPRLMIFMPPRHSKSEIASRRFPAWVVGRNPDWQLIASTYSGDFAADFGRDVRGIINDDPFRVLFPGVTLAKDSKAANRWGTNHGGVYIAVGVGGATTGRGAHVFLIDDPIKDWAEAESKTIREARWNWYLSVARTRLMPGGGIVLIMTRWNDDDLAGRLLAQMESGEGERWEIVSLPALAVGLDDPLGRAPGDALWPDWFPLDALESVRRVLPTRHWNALYQQNPVPEEGDFFKAAWFHEYTEQPEHLTIYLAADYAVTDGGGDFTELGVFGVDPNDDLYILDWWYGQATADVWIDRQLDLMELHCPIDCTGESGPIRRAIEPFLIKRMFERKVYTALDWLPSIHDKPTRARAFQGRASMGKVYLPKGKEWATRLLQQLLRFPAGATDDGVDVCSLIGRRLDRTYAANVPEKRETKTMAQADFDLITGVDQANEGTYLDDEDMGFDREDDDDF